LQLNVRGIGSARRLQIFMPDLSDIPRNKVNQNISIEWMKNRNLPPPADIVASEPRPTLLADQGSTAVLLGQ
jgi:hypothetical protein